MDVRPYGAADRESCLALFDSHPSLAARLAERELFARFLDSGPHPYFVMEHEGQAVGCGGYALQLEARMASLRWGIVGALFCGQGLGRFLLMYRLKEISKSENIQTVTAEVPPELEGFFAGQGFRTGGVSGGHIQMLKKLAVCA